MARLSHADQGRLSLPRFDPRCADRARPGAFPRSCKALLRTEGTRHTGVAQLLFQIADDGSRAVSRARPVHSVDEAEEHTPSLEGRRTDHAPGTGVLRLAEGGAGAPARAFSRHPHVWLCNSIAAARVRLTRMKHCPSCHAAYPSDYTHCPRDGSSLTTIGEWAEGTLVRGKYRILAKVGQGGMASVYKAVHVRFKET